MDNGGNRISNEWEIIGKLRNSEHKRKILEFLNESEVTPKEISDHLKVKFSHVSRTLKELKKMKLVQLLTPDLHVGRLYGITALEKRT